MTKRRDFIKKSVLGTSGIAISSMAFKCKSPASAPTLAGNIQPSKDWHTDPEWSKIKYGDWGGPGVSNGPGQMDTNDIDKPDYTRRVVAELVRCYNKGACGVGEIIYKGFGIT